MTPNLYIVGTQKSGTTTLFDWLGLSDHVHAPADAKDFPYFTRSHVHEEKERFRAMFRDAPANGRWRLGAEANLCYAEGGIDRLAAELPDATLIMVMRHPVERAFSAWRYARERSLDTRSFEQAVADELNGKVHASSSYEGLQMNYLGHSDYAAQCRALVQRFPRERIIFAEYDDLFRAEAGRQTLLQKLDLPDLCGVDVPRSNKTAGGFRSAALNRALNRERRGRNWSARMAKAVFPSPVRRAIRARLTNFNRVETDAAPTLAPSLRAELCSHFSSVAEEMEQFSVSNLDRWKV